MNADEIAHAKNVDIVVWLAARGHHPAYRRGTQAWYCSPLRDERTPSFRVRTDINKWADYGTDTRLHDTIDLVMLMQHTGFRQSVADLNSGSFSLSGHSSLSLSPSTTTTEGATYENIRELPITAKNLIRYLSSRGITVPRKEEAPSLCELHFNRPGGREQWHIGWRNDAGGYVVRRATDEPGAKCKKFNIGRTDITTIRHNAARCYIFEGFMDYLSFLALNHREADAADAIVLNSVNNKRQAVDTVKAAAYSSVHLLLDRDQAGDMATDYIISCLPSVDVKDERQCIKHGKDVNDELVWRSRHSPI